MNEENQPGDPFAQFINASLNMDGIEGLDQAAIAEKVRRILHELPVNVTSDLWNDRLDPLQAIIRVCLDLDSLTGAFEERLDPANVSRDDLEVLIMLSVTFAFVSFNQLNPSYNMDETQHSDDVLLARRLRDSLQMTLGWVKRAAREGDPVARRLAEEVNTLLDTSKHLD